MAEVPQSDGVRPESMTDDPGRRAVPRGPPHGLQLCLGCWLADRGRAHFTRNILPHKEIRKLSPFRVTFPLPRLQGLSHSPGNG